MIETWSEFAVWGTFSLTAIGVILWCADLIEKRSDDDADLDGF